MITCLQLDLSQHVAVERYSCASGDQCLRLEKLSVERKVYQSATRTSNQPSCKCIVLSTSAFLLDTKMSGSKPVAIVIGASRGIGRQVAIDLAKNGYAGEFVTDFKGILLLLLLLLYSADLLLLPPVVIAAKTTSDASKCVPFPPDPNSPSSTINTVAREITEAGGDATALPVDVRDYDNIQDMVRQTAEKYGRIDVVVYNSGAIWWSSVEKTPMKRFQLMQRVNPEGLYGTVQAVLPHLYRNDNGRSEGEGKGKGKGRIVVISPPIYSRFVKGKAAYAMGKFGMSTLTIGLAVDFEREGRTDMAITSLWPAVVSLMSSFMKKPWK